MIEKNASMQIQAVLYHNNLCALERSLLSLANAARVAQEKGLLGSVTLCWGDASKEPLYAANTLDRLHNCLQDTFGQAPLTVQYQFFNENTGYGKGHNRMFAACESDLLLILNPDIVVPQDFFEAMLAPFSDGTVGLTEARQTPVEHPKKVDTQTGEVEWASGACFVIPAPLFRELGGFDDHNFFMYFEDVDLSMRIRQKQKRLIYCANAPVYHSKGFDKKTGQMCHAASELYFSAEASLAFAYKWHQSSWLSYLRSVYKSGTDHQKRALAAFEDRLSKGELTRIEGDTSVFKRKYLDNRYEM